MSDRIVSCKSCGKTFNEGIFNKCPFCQVEFTTDAVAAPPSARTVTAGPTSPSPTVSSSESAVMSQILSELRLLRVDARSAKYFELSDRIWDEPELNFQERRAADPMVDFRLWKNPLIAVANATNLLSGMVISGVIAFLPTFAQGVLGSSAMRAGFTLSAMSIGWPIASVLAGRWFTRLGARRLARQGVARLVQPAADPHPVALAAEPDELVVLRDDLCSGPGEVQREGRHLAT